MKRILFLLALAACSPRAEHCDFTVDEACVSVVNEAPWTAPDVPERLRETFEKAAEYWGGKKNDLEGLSLSVVDHPSCGVAGGCFVARDWAIEVTQGEGPAPKCVEGSAVFHELGHLFLYAETGDADGGHTDPRWDGIVAAIKAFAPDCFY